MGMVFVDKDKYERPIHHTNGKVRIDLFIPRLLIPYTVDGQYEKASDSFVIKFSYGDVEQDRLLSEDNNICLMAGKNSKKLTKIIIKEVGKKRINEVSLTQAILKDVSQAIEKQKASLRIAIEQVNFENSKTILQENAKKLTEFFDESCRDSYGVR
jgi:hypothetical protein